MSKGQVGDEVHFTKAGLVSLKDDALIEEHELVKSYPMTIVSFRGEDEDQYPGYAILSVSYDYGHGVVHEEIVFGPDEYEVVEKVDVEEAREAFVDTLRDPKGFLNMGYAVLARTAFDAGWEAGRK